MAESIRPWLVEYLVGIGETVGGNLQSTPLHEKKKKIQLVEFLTYGIASQDDCLWAKLSDKHHKIPVRFTKAALAEYARSTNKRLTEHKTALVSIKAFRPFFARVPLPNGNGMSEMAFLALDVDCVSIIGSIGEAQWGDPQDIEANDDIRLWSEGLRRDGGSCNILAEMKKLRDVRDAHPEHDPRQDKIRDPLPVVPKKRNGVHHHGVKPQDCKIPEKFTPYQPGSLKDYERSWRDTVRNPLTFGPNQSTSKNLGRASNQPPSPLRRPSAEAARPRRRACSNPLDLGSSPPADLGSSPARDQQTTPPPEEWLASQSPEPHDNRFPDLESQDCRRAHQSPVIKLEEDDEVLPSTFDCKPSKPDQRRKILKLDAFPSPPTSSPPHPSPTSSILPISTSTPNSSLIAHQRTRAQVVRRVPYPVQPPPPSTSSYPRILAPNSDTSQSQSQPSQILSKSQLSPGTFTPDRALEDKEDESHIQSYLFTQPDGYEGDQSMTDQNSEIMNKSFDGSFTLPPGEDSGISLTAATEPPQDSIVGEEQGEEANGEDQAGGVDDSQAPSLRNEDSDSIVPDSQGDQMDDDDAQIDASLFGKTQSYVADESLFGKSQSDVVEDSTAEVDPKPVVDGSLSDEQPSFSQLHHDAKRDAKSPVRLLGSNNHLWKFVSDHDPETWRAPAFMRDTNAKDKGKQRPSTPASENPLSVLERTAEPTRRSTSKTHRVASPPANQFRSRSASSFTTRPVASSSRISKVSPPPAPPALGQSTEFISGVPNIDLRLVSRGSRKRSRMSECSIDVDGIVEGSVKKQKRRTWDPVSFKAESPVPQFRFRDAPKLDGPRIQPYATGDLQMTTSADARRQLKAFVSGIRWDRHRPNEPSSDDYDPDRPPWMSWPTLEAILLETGRYRDKQAKQAITSTAGAQTTV